MTEEPQGENDLDAAKTRKVVEITARGFFDQMLSYGFTRNDIVHFTTDILDLVMDAAPASPPRRHAPTTYPVRYETSADGKVIGIDRLDLRKISAKTVDSNLANINLNRRLGFQFEGHLSKEVRLRDSYVDLTVMGVLKDKFLELGASERDASPSE